MEGSDRALGCSVRCGLNAPQNGVARLTSAYMNSALRAVLLEIVAQCTLQNFELRAALLVQNA
jgi:hypothetical protein